MNLKQLQLSVFMCCVLFIHFTRSFEQILYAGDAAANKLKNPCLYGVYILVKGE